MSEKNELEPFCVMFSLLTRRRYMNKISAMSVSNRSLIKCQVEGLYDSWLRLIISDNLT